MVESTFKWLYCHDIYGMDIYCLYWKSLKSGKKCFLFHLKNSFSFSRYLNFCLDLLWSCLIRKTRLIPKYTRHKLGNKQFQKSKGKVKAKAINQTIKVCQFIEYNMRSIFLEKSYIKWDRETIPRTFPKKSELNISLDK